MSDLTPPAAPAPVAAKPSLLDRVEGAVRTFVGNYARMGWIGLVAAGLVVAVVLFADQQILVGTWKLAQLAVAAFGGYWLDRHAFPYARPHSLTADDNNGCWTRFDTQGNVFAACMYRRAFIMGATMIAAAVAL